MKIYVASSWRNAHQPAVVEALRKAGHDVYDFRNPAAGNEGFHWSEISGNWKTWNVEQYAAALQHPVAERGFRFDMDALEAADLTVLVLPSGRSASWEYGHWCGRRNDCGVIYIPEAVEPELMYRGAVFAANMPDLILKVGAWKAERGL